MSKRISASQWSYFKTNFPHDVSASEEIVVDTGSSLFKRNYIRRTKLKKTIDRLKLNEGLQEMMDWCDECVEHQFYVESFKDPESYGRQTSFVKFHFFNEDDAVLFKMTWWQ